MNTVERLTEAFTELYRPYMAKPAPLSMRDMAERLVAADPQLATAIDLGLRLLGDDGPKVLEHAIEAAWPRDVAGYFDLSVPAWDTAAAIIDKLANA